MKEVYCLQWTGTNRIADDECYDDREYAEERIKIANRVLSCIHKLCGHKWIIRTLKVNRHKIQQK